LIIKYDNLQTYEGSRVLQKLDDMDRRGVIRPGERSNSPAETWPKPFAKRDVMSSRASSIKSAVADFMVGHRIPGEMEQNLLKEAIHLHLLSALSEARVLRHVVFQGGTALRLCYGGERYSEDLHFVRGRTRSNKIEFDRLVRDALEATKKSLHRSFDIDQDQIAFRQPAHPMAIKSDSGSVVAWQIVVPIGPTPRSPKSCIKIEFANVPSYDCGPNVVRATPGLVQVEDIILTVERPDEILADKVVALTAGEVMKYRDVWDVWYLINKLDAQAARDMVRRKFADYGVADVEAKAKHRCEELARLRTARPFLEEMRRFLPAKRVAETSSTGLHRAMLATSEHLIEQVVL
jgi:predicted nucleotidyltransferase component of viral defense system